MNPKEINHLSAFLDLPLGLADVLGPFLGSLSVLVFFFGSFSEFLAGSSFSRLRPACAGALMFLPGRDGNG